MAPATTIPDAPKHLPAKAQKQWQSAYTDAFAQAQKNIPDSESAQRGAAAKVANSMLSIPAPKSAKDIDALEDWQVLMRETRTANGIETRVCVTSDGQKYAFPIGKAPKPPEPVAA